MNFQQRLIEASTDLRTRAAAFGTAALDVARSRAGVTARRVDVLKKSLATLSVAGRALNKVAQRHAARFVKENSAIAVAASKDVSAVARSTYASLSGRKVVAKTRKPRATRRRASSKAA
jgi:hypothetical protein